MTELEKRDLRSLYEDYKILDSDFKKLERENKELKQKLMILSVKPAVPTEIEKENEFLRKRENKLQLIEQLFKNEPVDLSELAKLVKGSGE